MKIYLIHSSKYDYQKELYIPLKHSLLSKLYEIIFLYDETKNPGSTKEIIKKSDLIIAEVSYSSIGPGIELGWADAFKIPIICLYKKDAKISQFLSILTDKMVKYSNAEEMIEKLTILIN